MELNEEGSIILQNEIQQTSEVLTPTDKTEIPANEHKVMRHPSKRRNKVSVLLRLDDFLYYEWRGKT